MKLSTSPPPVAQMFVDDEGVYWSVKNVIEGRNLDGFFLVSMNHGKTADCVDGNLVLAPSEYEALVRTRGLRAMAPDLAHPVPLATLDTTALPPLAPSGSDAVQ